MRIAAILLALLVAVCIVGCPRARTSLPAPKAPMAKQPTSEQMVNVELGQWYVKLNPSTVNAGQVHFMVKNAGSYTHAFEVKGQGIDAKTPNIPAGQSAALTTSLKSGTYDTFCPIDGHKNMGMDAKLTVK